MRFLQCISFRCRLIARVLVVLALSGFGVYHQTASGVAAAARCIREANDHTLSLIDDRSHDEETNRAIGETVAHSTELVKESNAALLPLVQPYGLEELPVLPQ